MPNLSDLFSAGGFLKWDGAGNTDADYTSQAAADLAADAAFTGAFAQGERLWIPAARFQKAAGSPALDTLRSGGNGWPAWLLDAASAEAVQVAELLPGPWANYTSKVYWANAGAGTGDVVLNTSYGAAHDGENITSGGSTIFTGATKTVTAAGQYILKVTTMDVGLTAEPDDVQTFRIARNAADAADTLANDIAIFGVMLEK